MIELPESINLARQLDQAIKNKIITAAVAGDIPHKFAFYQGDPAKYNDLLAGEHVRQAVPMGGYIDIKLENHCLILGEDIIMCYIAPGEHIPSKHQLLLHFSDGSAIIVTIKMFGALYVYPSGEYSVKHHLIAAERPNPLTDEFDLAYFMALAEGLKTSTSVKAFLATEQRIPGLGNGVLQDILFHANIHPKSKLNTLSAAKMEKLFSSIKSTLATMTAQNGRNTEKDLYGIPGKYQMLFSSKTLGTPCPACNSAITKLTYMGGSVYFCSQCQPLS